MAPKVAPARSPLSEVPRRSGVYIFKGPGGRVLYVGKAKDLRSRIGSYFRKSAGLDVRKSAMVKSVHDFSFIVTKGELEAFALEANLIKQYKPKFNVIFRDDKNYPYIKVNIHEEWPNIEVVRKIKKDGALYFGPYVPSGVMWEALAFIRRHFNIRPCRYRLEAPMRPCIQYEMRRCPAPCAGLISREDYRKAVSEAVRFLKGERKELLGELEARMQRLSDEMRFEEAGVIRDRINALKGLWESQRVISPGLSDIDVIGHHMEGSTASFQVFFVRNGLMTGARDFHLKNISGVSEKELYHGFIGLFYAKEVIPPGEIVVGVSPEGKAELEKWLGHRRGGAAPRDIGAKVRIFVPKKGKRLELLRMAVENARVSAGRRKGGEAALEELKERLSLERLPRTIGAFDVSTIGGSESVGAYILWEDGQFNKDLYRHVKIKTVEGMDDYAMMEETVKRVLKDITRGLVAPKSRGLVAPPDLIVIDGGRGQLESAMRALISVEKASLTLVAVAKDPDRAFTLKGEGPLDLEDRRPSSLLLKRIRDEAHRFAIGFHRRLRAKRLMESPLEKVPGIGKKRRLALLRRFGSLDAVRKAAIEELASAPGMNRKAAEALKEGLRAPASRALR